MLLAGRQISSASMPCTPSQTDREQPPPSAAVSPASPPASQGLSPSQASDSSHIPPAGDALLACPSHTSAACADCLDMPEASSPPASARKPSALPSVATALPASSTAATSSLSFSKPPALPSPAADPLTSSAAADGLSSSCSSEGCHAFSSTDAPLAEPMRPSAAHASVACVLKAFKTPWSAKNTSALSSPAAGSLTPSSAPDGLSPSRGYDGRHIFLTGDPPLAGSVHPSVTATYAASLPEAGTLPSACTLEQVDLRQSQEMPCTDTDAPLPSACSLKQVDPSQSRDMPCTDTEDPSVARYLDFIYNTSVQSWLPMC